jgi:hypothetical protein
LNTVKALKALILLPVIVLLGLGAGAVFAQLDTATPVISAVEVTNITETSATITWSTDAASDSLVRFGASQGALTSGVANPTVGTAHSVLLSGLSPDTRYFFEVQSADASGNIAVDNSGGDFYSFITREARVVRKAFVGEVLRKSSKAVTLTQQVTGERVTIVLPRNYTLQTPGGPRAGTFQREARVVILAQLIDEDWVALRVLVKPEKPNLPVTGVVVSVDPASVTLMTPDGAQHAFSRPATDKGLAAGDVVTVFRGNDAKAKGQVKADEVRDRLEKFLENIKGIEEIDTGGQRLDSLTQTLDDHGAQQLQIMNQVLQQAPEHVKLRIRDEKDKTEAEIEASKAVAAQAKAKFRPDQPEDAGSPPQGNNGQGRGENSQEADKGQGKEDSSAGGGGGQGKENSPGNGNGPASKENQEKGNGPPVMMINQGVEKVRATPEARGSAKTRTRIIKGEARVRIRMKGETPLERVAKTRIRIKEKALLEGAAKAKSRGRAVCLPWGFGITHNVCNRRH